MSRRGRNELGPVGPPQVNLLPPEVRAKRALGRLKSYLVMGLGAVVLLACGGIVYGVFSARDAQAELELAEADAHRLQNEQAQYAEVPRIKAEIADLETLREVGMGTEILWSDYVAAIDAVAPSDMTLLTLATATPSPLLGPVAAANPLAGPSVGSITFTGRSVTLPDTAAWIEALETIPGFSDAIFSSAAIAEDDGAVFYQVASTVQVNTLAFSDRFVPEPEVGATGEPAAGGGTAPEATATAEGGQPS